MFDRGLIAVFAVLLTACAIAPTQDMADARVALRTAEQSGGREYSGMLLGRAKRALAEAEAQLESGLYSDAQASARKALGAALAARSIAEEISAANRELIAGQQLSVPLTAAESALREALAAGSAGQEDAAVRSAQRAAELARSQIDRYYLERARMLRMTCEPASDRAELARADAELSRRRGAAALEILQRICTAH